LNIQQQLRTRRFAFVRSGTESRTSLHLLERTIAAARRAPGFVIVVVVPTFLAFLYYGLIAADIYVAVPQFIVKDTNQNASLSGLGAFLQSTGLANSVNDAYAVNAYLASRDALRELEKSPGVRMMYDRPEADFISRFPNLLFSGSFENLYRWHYSYWVDVEFDSTTSITTIYVYGYRPDDVQAIGRRLLSLGETMVNRMNDRARADAVRGARREVDQLQQRASNIEQKITDFRDKNLIIDPNQSSTEATSLLATLEGYLASAQASVSKLEQSAPGSPQIPVLRAQIRALEKQITDEEHKSAGGDSTLAPKMAQYGALLLQQAFVQQMLQAAVSSLETSEASMQQQQLYLEEVSGPNRPDRAQYPYRILDILLTFFTACLLYLFGRIFNTVIREHLAK
jgi:capsular polysaccharide transport system permease protein